MRRSRTRTVYRRYVTDTPTFKCSRCNQEFPRDQKVVKVIHGRDREDGQTVLTEEMREFCCTEHASHEQFSREG